MKKNPNLEGQHGVSISLTHKVFMPHDFNGLITSYTELKKHILSYHRKINDKSNIF